MARRISKKCMHKCSHRTKANTLLTQNLQTSPTQDRKYKPRSNAVRLLDFNSPNNVRLVDVYGAAICGECWTQANADVTCRGLGYIGGKGYLIQRSSVPHIIYFWTGRHQCDGTESGLLNCRWIYTQCPQCGHVAAVKCVQISLVNGGWSRWSNFGSCSLTCGQGYRIRTRTCDNPTPQHGGRDCDGDEENVTTCSNTWCTGIMIAVVAVFVALLLAVAVIFLIKRKRLTKAKSEDDPQHHPVPVNYSNDAVQVVAGKSTDNYQYLECVAGPSEDTNHYSEGTAGPSTDTDDFGYGLLSKTGTRSVRMGEEDMYSHTKPGQLNDDGYDVFVKRKKTVDESDIYDHGGKYDIFQRQKVSFVENDYSQIA
ncbi:uncharacterized protein [Argopecten irradians]|uniref:uncharacterized protein n=1 Tax=Argopecten irradians TaxID=31199 RepID=UPI00371861E9